ncbi:MAG TPA: hypothetical protein VF556_07665 [Pyrinomonadaceae bacterium]|jgi:hypothetical protein
MAIRHCSFCEFAADYDDFPDGSICYLGICACANCLEKEVTKDFRDLLTEEGFETKNK